MARAKGSEGYLRQHVKELVVSFRSRADALHGRGHHELGFIWACAADDLERELKKRA